MEYCFADDLLDERIWPVGGKVCGSNSFIRCSHWEMVLCFDLAQKSRGQLFANKHGCSEQGLARIKQKLVYSKNES